MLATNTQKLEALAILAMALMLPAVTSAASHATVNTMIEKIGTIIGTLIPIIMAIALLIFFWGLAMYMFKADDSTARGEAINIMVMGIIVLFVMVSVWGLVGLLGSTFGVKGGEALRAPGIPESAAQFQNRTKFQRLQTGPNG